MPKNLKIHEKKPIYRILGNRKGVQMGLATSQVRLLALTSRKADVEMQIQLNSKRKTMLTRESTELAKLYYAKLQNSKIQYAVTNGYKDVTYNYLMGQYNAQFFEAVLDPSTASKYGIEKKIDDNMLLTDNYGRVILDDSMLRVIVEVFNQHEQGGGITVDGNDYKDDGSNSTTETFVFDAMSQLLTNMSKEPGHTGIGTSVNEVFQLLYSDKNSNGTVKSSADRVRDFKILQSLYELGVQDGGVVYSNDNNTYYSDYTMQNKISLSNWTFYIVKNSSGHVQNNTSGGRMHMTNNSWADEKLQLGFAKNISNMFSYYGAIFSAAFNGVKTFDGQTLQHYNVAANLTYDSSRPPEQRWAVADNSKYTSVSNSQQLQDGLKSGIYDLINVSSKVTGGYAKGQGLDFFKTQNYLVEQSDTQSRETITAWYNAARADLNEKESYWDSEITALSTELTTITTEIDSVKKLREDAISSTFKWGSA